MKYTVTLSAHGNPDRRQDPNSEIADSYVTEADSIEECQKAVRWYIDTFCIGSGNWTGGAVYEDGEQSGYISYNGRYWPKGSEYYTEV